VTSELMAAPGGPAAPGGRSRRGADAIVAALAGAGTRQMFGVPGGGPNPDVVGAAAAAGMSFIDPATYPAVMDLTRGEAGRRRAAGYHLSTGPHRLSGRYPSTGT
jgi:hypothetical protein